LFRRSPAAAFDVVVVHVVVVSGGGGDGGGGGGVNVVIVARAHTATGNWWYAVGSTDKYGAGIPGGSDVETQVELYVKCKLGAGSRTLLIACNYASVRAFACVSSQ